MGGMNEKPNGTVGTCDAPWILKQSRFSICFFLLFALLRGEVEIKWKVNFHQDFHHQSLFFSPSFLEIRTGVKAKKVKLYDFLLVYSFFSIVVDNPPTAIAIIGFLRSIMEIILKLLLLLLLRRSLFLRVEIIISRWLGKERRKLL